MLKYAEDKKTYKDLHQVDLNKDCVVGKYDVIISVGVFIDKHVRLEKIFDFLD
jgi:hypothetical protein